MTIGGGLCQLSNALYDAALQAGLHIVEQHAHTRVIAGSLAEIGRDATVFWNYVDLRFKSNHAFRIEAQLTSDDLIVRFRGEVGARLSLRRSTATMTVAGRDNVTNCFTCEAQECFRHIRPVGRKGAYELRVALRDLRTQITVNGPLLEGNNFWQGFQLKRTPAGAHWLRDATVVVLPHLWSINREDFSRRLRMACP